MNQLTQKLKDGAMQVLEVPLPVLGPGMVLVRNRFSLISAGTESGTVTAARKSLIGKAKERPQQVKQVLDVLVQQGPVQTYRAVMKKLDAWSPLGYSCAGEVIDAASDVMEFAAGDLVACGGLSACHAEVVAAPKNLCVKLPKDADLKKGAYNTLGAIALQGIRQADLRLGESCAVIGLGLIGQLTCLMLRAAGVRVIGIDVDESAVQTAADHCADLALMRNDPGIEGRIDAFTSGVGIDAVIITAGSNSLDPVNFAGRICRKRGRVVIVGNVPTGFDRDPYYYRKELELRMSCSYGPGRYDPAYEEKGVDYPAAYVRWTEKRNMEAFQELVHSGKIDLNYLTTHVFPLRDAPQAYDLILQRKEPYLGILIEYDVHKPVVRERIIVSRKTAVGKVNVAFVGAGSYAQSHLLPNLPKSKDVVLKGVMTASGTSSRSVAERFGFEFCTSDERDIFGGERGLDSGIRRNDRKENRNDKYKNGNDKDQDLDSHFCGNDTGINTVFIATRHDSHAGYVLKALETGMHCFVEKPLCLSQDELAAICRAYGCGSSHLMVGFNRRFSPLASMMKEKIGSGPMSMLYRVNAGAIPADSWIQDRAVGGGRIIGEVCHFVDFLTFMNGSLPTEVFAQVLPGPSNLNDTLNIQIRFENGAVGAISYFANGPKSLPKEYIEIYRDGVAGIIRDFSELEFYSAGRPYRKKLLSQDKGQKIMVQAFISAILNGQATPIPFEEIHAVTWATLEVLESVRTGQVVRLNCVAGRKS